MAAHDFLPFLLPFVATLFARVFAFDVSVKASLLSPFNCSAQIKTCNASLYHINHNLKIEEIASFYSVNTSQIKPIMHGDKQDYLIRVPCSCHDTNGLSGYFYDTSYKLKLDETFAGVSNRIYSGQAWQVEEKGLIPEDLPIHLLCGCVESNSQIMVTYTVQLHDTVAGIATQLSAQLSGLVSMNKILLAQNPSFIDVGWVLFVPMEKNGIPSIDAERRQKWTIIIGILSTVTLLSMISLTIILIRRKRASKNSEEDPKAISKNAISNRAFSFKNHYLHKENMEDMTGFESERPVIFSIEEIEEATNNFDETQILGVGGYGRVYFGMLGGKEVAIKKMISNKTKEFYAELKVLCKIHHINVVELLGYASGEDHLYLVYEYVQNGSLSDHLHDPLLKGYQPLSWTARAQIALGTAKGIEYIHDHTKARYVHRDIKTSNILLDERLRAKVADFGLAKLLERTNDEDFIATRLVGTPGYLPPESVKELQVTPKTDVFAFGVVLAELLTGKRALFRDNQEHNNMKSLITIVHRVFQDEDPEMALEAAIDGNLRGSYPPEDVYKMAEISEWCLREDPVDRPEMREIVVTLSQIMMSSVEWEASLGGHSQVFSGVFNGR
ncbi:LysM receptor kinase [Quillaja saponaria]|uniref:LysM receptor kinase n=1 Tax=Quillaja saponaria TaxID=32244 RepID=A0AAD7L8G9_QUISA|nr:LysM receptor kinase [Quillaja saponaria]